MRNYVSGKSSENHLYNGLGGQESAAHSATVFSRPHSLAQHCQPRGRPAKASKQKPSRTLQHSDSMTAAKNLQLDAFFRKYCI
ncbi:hypothetical protein AAHC03_019498 [Spirometra sp. Aus1]